MSTSKNDVVMKRDSCSIGVPCVRKDLYPHYDYTTFVLEPNGFRFIVSIFKLTGCQIPERVSK